MTDPKEPTKPEAPKPSAPTPPAPRAAPAPPAPAGAPAAAPELNSIPGGEMDAFDAEIDAALAVATGTTTTLAAALKSLGDTINSDTGGLNYGDQDIRGALVCIVDLARFLGAAGRTT